MRYIVLISYIRKIPGLEAQRKKGMLIGYFEKEDSETYKVFAKVAKIMKKSEENF